MADIYTDGLSNFRATEINVAPLSQKGKEWIQARMGAGAVGFAITREGWDRMAPMLERDGLTWADCTDV